MEGGLRSSEEAGKAAFHSLHKCCLLSRNKPVKLEVPNERGESQGSRLYLAAALDSVLSLAEQSSDFSVSGPINPKLLLLNEPGQFVTNLT